MAQKKTTTVVTVEGDVKDSGIYVADYEVVFGKDDEMLLRRTLYCRYQHDLSVNLALKKCNLGSKRIKSITIKIRYQNGESIARPLPIRKWKITNETSN